MEERAHRGRLPVWSFLWLAKIVCSVFNSDWRHILGTAIVSCPNLHFSANLSFLSSFPQLWCKVSFMGAQLGAYVSSIRGQLLPALPPPASPSTSSSRPMGHPLLMMLQHLVPPQGARSPCALLSGVQCRIWWGGRHRCSKAVGTPFSSCCQRGHLAPEMWQRWRQQPVPRGVRFSRFFSGKQKVKLFIFRDLLGV